MLKKFLLLLVLLIPGFVPAPAEASNLNTGNCQRPSGVSQGTGITFSACKTAINDWSMTVAPPPNCYGGQSGCDFFLKDWVNVNQNPITWRRYATTTPSGTIFGTWTQTAVVECPTGTTEDEFGDCIPDYENPCPEGQLPGPSGLCYAAPGEEPDPPCRNLLGYVNGQPVCGDERDECEALGGTYGTIGDTVVCIPESEDPPTCQAGTFLFAGEGGYVCVPPDDKLPDDDTPDPDDPDGDESPNDVDEDDDGDGNADTTDGFSEVAAGAGQCDPTSQDYAACLRQVETVSSTQDQAIQQKANLSGDLQLGKLGTIATQAIGSGDAGIGGPSDLEDEITGLSIFNGINCVDITQTIMGSQLLLSCAKTQPLRDMLGYFFALLTLMAVFNIATQKGPN